ncbi:choline-sulfatase [Nesterenkonia sp. NBAIMH1]|uniref:choline-sulfatase n=1 Tax=Nesterenkonia sp. NBAIMH1 TaxID=2600320 RepID=UPI0011B3E0C5|nr:choline-sulfatase [Nesterenkonia sp. NBAIMH1]
MSDAAYPQGDGPQISQNNGTVSPPEEGAPARPNIVVIQADQMAAQSLGAYGDQAARTPTIDALAQEGAVFDRAYCSTPLCAPSRASMMTGRLPSEIGCYDNGDDFTTSEPTFAHRLRRAGYHTALIGRMHFIGPDQHHGFEERLTTDVYPADLDMVPDWNLPMEEKLQWYHDADAVFTAGASKATVQQDFDDEVTWRTLRHLNDRARANQRDRREGRQEQPFLMVTSYIHPHDPYEPPAEHWDRFDDVDIPDPAHPETPDAEADPHTHRLRAMSGFDKRDPSADEVRRARRAYYAAVSYIDDQIAAVTQRLEYLGLAENTVIMVTSDHGDMLGEKGLWYKMSPYERSSRVPMIMTGPEGLVPRGRFSTNVSLLDVAPTLSALALDDQGEAELPGRPLHVLADQEAAAGPEERDVLIEYLAEGTHRPHLTLVRGSWKLSICPGDPDHLYNVAEDPEELTNLADSPEHAEQLELMRKELHSRYGLESLEHDVLASQRRRQLVADALATGEHRAFDFAPSPEQRYVRGDFWSALEHGKISDPAR